MEKMDHLSRQNGSMNRRSFLRLSGLLGLGVATAGLVPIPAEAVKFGRLYKVSKTRLAMGTIVSMTLIHPSRDQAEEAMGLAFTEIDRLTRLMSRFDDATAVAHLNREGFLRDIPPEVSQIVARASDYHRLSGGAFDITVKPLVDLFQQRLGGDNKTAPTEKELRNALELVNAANIRVNGRTIAFKKPGMGITLDGIAKGYIVDSASAVLSRQKIDNHLINAGGDIRTMGTKADRKPWTVAIQDPQKKRNYPDVIHMRDGAIATSGNYEIYFDQEKMFHHIVNPRTGLSPELSASVSVIADNTMEADALSTSVFVMSPEKGTAFINTLPRCESLVIDKAGRETKSKGWKSA